MSEQHELLVKLGLESSSFTRNIRNVNNQLKLVEAEFKNVESASKNFGNAKSDLTTKLSSFENKMEALRAKTILYEKEIDKLEDKIKEETNTRDKLCTKLDEEQRKLAQLEDTAGKNAEVTKKQREEVKSLQQQYDKSVKQVETFTNSLQKNQIQLANTETEINQLGHEIDDLNYKIKTFSLNNIATGLDTLSNKFTSFGDTVSSLGQKLTTSITLPVAGIGTTVAKMGAEFEASMSEVGALSGTTGAALKELENKAREMGEATSFSAKDSADALGYMALAGWDVNQMLTGIEPVLRLAEAGNMDLATASDLVTDSMATLGLGVEDLSTYLDNVAVASTKSNASVQQILQTYNQVGGTFKRFGTELDESSALLGVLANRGLKAEQAGRSLSSVMINLTSGTGQAGDALEDLGIKAYDTNGEFKGVEVVLKELYDELYKVENGTKKYTDAQRDSYLAMIGGKTQIRTLDALLVGVGETTANGKTEFENLKESLQGVDGALEEMAYNMKDNVMGDWERFTSALSETALQLNDILKPAIRDFLQKLTELTEKFNALDDDTQKFILKVAGITAAIGPALLIVGGFSKGLGSLFGIVSGGIKSFISLGKTLTDVGKAVKSGSTLFTALSGSIVGFPVIIGTVAAAFVGLVAVFGENESWLARLQEKWGEFGTFIGYICESISGMVQLVFGNVGIIFSTLAQIIGKIVTMQWNEVDDVFNEGMAKLQQNINKAWSNITAESTNAISKIRELTSEEMSGMVDDLDVILNELPNLTYDTADSMAEKFANSFQDLSNDSISIMSSTSETLNMLFRGIDESMDNKQAAEQYQKNLEVMARTGGVSVDALKLEIDKTLSLINDNMADSNTRFTREAESIMETLSKASSTGIKNAAENVSVELANLNTTSLTHLQGMSDNWSRVFKNVSLDGSQSTAEMAKLIEANLNTMAKNNPKIVSELVSEMQKYLDELPEDAGLTMEDYASAVAKGSEAAKLAASMTGEEIEKELEFNAANYTEEELIAMEAALNEKTPDITQAASDLGVDIANSYSDSLTGMDLGTQTALNNQQNTILGMGDQNYSAMAGNAHKAVSGFVETWDSNEERINSSINNTFENLNSLNTISWGSTTKAFSEINKWLGTITESSSSTSNSLKTITSITFGSTTKGLSEINRWLTSVSQSSTNTINSLRGITNITYGNVTKGLSEINRWLTSVSQTSGTTANSLKSITNVTYGSTTKGLSEINKWLGTCETASTHLRNGLKGVTDITYGSTTKGLSEIDKWIKTCETASKHMRNGLKGINDITYGSTTKGLSEINKWLGTVKTSANSATSSLKNLASVSYGGVTSQLSSIYSWLSKVKNVAATTRSGLASISTVSLPKARVITTEQMVNIDTNYLTPKYNPLDFGNLDITPYQTSINKNAIVQANEYKNNNSNNSIGANNNELVSLLMKQNELLMGILNNNTVQLNTYLDGKQVASATAKYIRNEINLIDKRKNRLAGI